MTDETWLAARLSEPSTYAGIGLVLSMLVPIIEGTAAAATWPERAVVVLTGIAAIVKKEAA